VFFDYLIIYVIKCFQQFLRVIPEKIQHKIGVHFGRLAYLVLKKRRDIAITNLQRVFPDLGRQQRADIAKRCFEKLGINFIELLLIPFIPKERYIELFEVQNRHYIDDALKMNKGLIALGFHYANWEIMGIVSFFLNQDMVVLARPLKKHQLLNNFLNSLRSSTGLKIIHNVDTAKDVMKHLKDNKIVGILGDQREKRSRGVYVEFFGEKVPTTRGIVAIAMKTASPVIPGYCVRKGFLRYQIIFNEPILIERNGDIQELVYRNTRRINAFLESIILKNPDEWFWVHRRWGRNS